MRVAITGANSGIGLRAVRRFAESGADVIALSRSRERGELAIATLQPEARARVRLVELDLASPVSIAGAAETVVADGPLDVLINNAAVFDLSAREARFTETGQELFWATNHLGPTEFTARVSGALAAAPSPRVVFVASKGLVTMPGLAIRFDALTDGSWFTPTKAYYHSKLAQVMTAVTLAERVGDLVDVDIALQTFDHGGFKLVQGDGLVRDFPERDHRVLVIVTVNGQLAANRQLTRPLGGHHDELKAVRNFKNAVFDGNAGHLANLQLQKEEGI